MTVFRDPLPKIKIKDSVFEILFRDKTYLLMLYLILHPEDTTISKHDLKNVKIENLLTDNLYNDLGFSVRDNLLVLVEAQAAWSENLILRGLFYLIETLKRYIARKKYKTSQYKKLRIPGAELYLLYTGDRKPDKDVISFIEHYGLRETNSLEVKMYLLHPSLEGTNILSQYSRFCSIQTEIVKKLGRTNKAIQEIIRLCIEQDILKDFLIKHKIEVINVMELLFGQERLLREYVVDKLEKAEKKGFSRGRMEGFSQGEKQGRLIGEKQGRAMGEKQGIAIGRQEEREESLRNLVEVCQDLGLSITLAVQQLMARYELSEEQARQKVLLYWRK